MFTPVKPGRRPQYRFGDVATWAKAEWPKQFRDFPSNPNVIQGNLVLLKPSMTGHIRTLPTSLSECHEALDVAHRTIAGLRAENAELRPLAEKYQQQRKGGRPKKG
jgi:hypothetical protein